MSEQLVERLGDRVLQALLYCAYGEAALRLGRTEEARRYLMRADIAATEAGVTAQSELGRELARLREQLAGEHRMPAH